MQIYKINNNHFTNFEANKLNKNVSVKSMKKNLLYKDIDDFLNNKIDKINYIKNFNKNIDKIYSKSAIVKNLTIDEEMFISDLKTAIDIAENLNDISDKELSRRLEQFIKNSKKA